MARRRRRPGVLRRVAAAIADVPSQRLAAKGRMPLAALFASAQALWYGGERFSEQEAMRIAPFFAGVTRLTDTLGQLPLRLQRHTADGAVLPVESHPLLRLVARPDMLRPALTRTGLVRLIVQNLAIHGNCYVWARRRPTMEYPYALLPLDPRRVTVMARGYRPVYQVTPEVGLGLQATTTGTGRVMTLTAPDMCHFIGKYTDAEGWVGLSPLAYMRDVLRIGAEHNRHAIASLSGGAVRGFLKSPNPDVGEDVIARLKAQVNDPDNEGQWLVLEDEMEPHVVSANNEQAQFAEGRQALVEEFARYFGIPPHLLMAQQVTSWGTGIAEMTLGFVLYTMLPWGDGIEQVLGTSTMPDDERDSGLAWEFDFRRLLRGSPNDRAEFYRSAIDTGWMSVAEVRRLEGLRDMDEASKMLRTPAAPKPASTE